MAIVFDDDAIRKIASASEVCRLTSGLLVRGESDAGDGFDLDRVADGLDALLARFREEQARGRSARDPIPRLARGASRARRDP